MLYFIYTGKLSFIVNVQFMQRFKFRTKFSDTFFYKDTL